MGHFELGQGGGDGRERGDIKNGGEGFKIGGMGGIGEWKVKKG